VLSSNSSSRRFHNMVNFGPLAAEIGSGLWDTPANFNGFRVLGALLHGTPAVGVSRTLRHRTEGATHILPYFHIWCYLSANLECRSEMCCTRLAENAGRKKIAKNRHPGTIAQICRVISSQLRHVSTMGKKFLSSNMSSRCLHNIVNFSPLAAEIGPVVWSTPANFKGFRVLAALLHAIQ